MSNFRSAEVLPIGQVRKLSIYASIVWIVLLGSACSPSKDKAVAVAATEEFHRRFNALAFSEIYDHAEPGPRGEKRNFLASMEAMRNGQGAVLQAKELSVDYSYSTEGNMITLLYEVTYEKGIAREEFMWTIASGKGVLHRYRFLGPAASP